MKYKVNVIGWNMSEGIPTKEKLGTINMSIDVLKITSAIIIDNTETYHIIRAIIYNAVTDEYIVAVS